jgi:uroporphyrinogen-III synthase
VGLPEEKRFIHNIPAARHLRRPLTTTEAVLWDQLRDRRFLGLKFRRQHAVRAYVLDFYCHELRLAIEVDGSVHDDADQRRADLDRQTTLEELGINFYRIQASAIDADIGAVLDRLADHVRSIISPSPAKSGEGAGG